MRGSSTLCRPRESGHPYAAALRFSTVGRRLSNNDALWLWVPAFAGTTSGSTTFTFQTNLPCPDTPPRSRRVFCARFAGTSRPLQSEGAGNAGRPMRPIAACAIIVVERTRVSQVTPEFTQHSPRNGFNGFLRALPGDRAFLPPSPLRSLLLKNLTPASGRQDHTPSPSASAPFVRSASASTASHPASVTIAIRPSSGTRRGEF